MRNMTRDGFTLLELIVVMAVIMAIMAMLLPAIGAARSAQQVRATVAMVNTVNDAMVQHGTSSIAAFTDAHPEGKMYPLWDFNGDGIIDGDPEKDDNFTEVYRQAAADAGYRGALNTLGISLSDSNVDEQSRIVDSWRNPLRISRFPPESGRLWAWSTGPSGEADEEDNDDGDDIKPWRSTGDR